MHFTFDANLVHLYCFVVVAIADTVEEEVIAKTAVSTIIIHVEADAVKILILIITVCVLQPIHKCAILIMGFFVCHDKQERISNATTTIAITTIAETTGEEVATISNRVQRAYVMEATVVLIPPFAQMIDGRNQTSVRTHSMAETMEEQSQEEVSRFNPFQLFSSRIYVCLRIPHAL